MNIKYKLDYKKIAARIKIARRLAHLTQAELAEQIDISTNAVAKLENNLMTASLQTLLNIANVLNVDINYLLTDRYEEQANDSVELFLISQIQSMSPEEKAFLVHTIQGMKLLRAPAQEPAGSENGADEAVTGA